MPPKRGLSRTVQMSKPMEIRPSRLDEMEGVDGLNQPVEPPPPPPQLPKPPPKRIAKDKVSQPETDPYNPEAYAINIFDLFKEEIDGKTKPVHYTIWDNAIDVLREELDIYEYAVYTLLYRYSYGYWRSTCAVSYGEVAKQLKISSKKADMVLSTLEEKGIIQTIYGAYKKLRGKVYLVKLPREYVREKEEEMSKTKAFQELRNLGVI